MSYKKNRSYRDTPFSFETPQEDFFLYGPVSILHAKCESYESQIMKIRTVGILSNSHGRFYIKEMSFTYDLLKPPDPKQSIRVSLAYTNTLAWSCSMPCPVQLFGRLQWCDHPVIFAQIIQPLSVSVATLLHETMANVSTLQSSSHHIDTQELDY